MDDDNLGATSGAQNTPRPTIRARRPEDVDDCVEVLAAVHATDGYPLRWPEDPRDWLTPKHLLAAWVAEADGALVGHVRSVARPATGAPPCGRRLGAALLGQADAQARVRGLRSALEVLDHDHHAVALYEHAGWSRVASALAPWTQPDDDALVWLYYYIAPA